MMSKLVPGIHALEILGASIVLGWILGLGAVYIILTRFIGDEIRL